MFATDSPFITTIVAIYGALVATAVATWTIYSIQRDRARIKVTVRLAIVGYPTGPSTCVSFEAVNTGRRPVTLTGVGIAMPSKRDLVIIHRLEELPTKLEEGTSVTILRELVQLQQILQKECLTKPPGIAWFRDAAEKRHRGKIHRRLGLSLLGKDAS